MANGSAIHNGWDCDPHPPEARNSEELGVLYNAQVLEQAIDRAHARVVQVTEQLADHDRRDGHGQQRDGTDDPAEREIHVQK